MSDLYRFDLRTYHWEALPTKDGIPAPEGRASHAACSLTTGSKHGIYYVHGGSGAEWGRSSKNDLWCYTTKKRKWAQVRQKGHLPPPMYGHTLALHRDHTIILFGGTTGWDYFNDVYAFDILKSTWKTLVVKGSPPSTRYKHQSCIIKDSLYILGGGQFHAPDYPFDVHRFDLVSMCWEQIVAPNAPPGRLAHACAVAVGHPSQFQFRRPEPVKAPKGGRGKRPERMKRVRPASGSGRLDATSPERGNASKVFVLGQKDSVGKGKGGLDASGSGVSSLSDNDKGGITAMCENTEEEGESDEEIEDSKDSEFILVFGGKDNRDRKLQDMYSFDIHAKIWRCMSGPRKPPASANNGSGCSEGRMDPRDFHCMEVVNNHVLVFAGCAGDERLNDVWRYTMRRGPPSLQLLCARSIREQIELRDKWDLLETMPEDLKSAIMNLNPQAEELEFVAPSESPHLDEEECGNGEKSEDAISPNCTVVDPNALWWNSEQRAPVIVRHN